MRFKNSTHKRRFISAIKPMDQKDKTQMAVAFLLTATKALWDRSRICMMNNKILVHRIHLNHTSKKSTCYTARQKISPLARRLFL